MTFIEILSAIGIMFMGYFVFRIIEALIIGSWNEPKKWFKAYQKQKVGGELY